MVTVGETDWVPKVALAPVQPLEAVQEVASVEDQVRVEDWTFVIKTGEAEMVTVGAGVPEPTVTVAD